MPNEFIIRNGLVVQSGTTTITGSVTATEGFTGSLFGTASVATSLAGGALTNFIEGFSSATQATSFLSASNAAATVNVAIVPKGSGSLMAQVPNGTTTGGNARGAYSVDWQMVRDGATQVASGQYAVIAGGRKNIASSNYAAVGGGWQNTAANINAFIGAGYANTVTQIYGFIGAGAENLVSQGDVNTQYGVIGGGFRNKIYGPYESGGFIGGGYNNRINNGWTKVICGGSNNTVDGSYSSIGGGNTNTITQYQTSARIGGGQNNTVSNNYGTIAGGINNTVSGEYGTIAGGTVNIASGQYSVVGGGSNNRASAQYAMILGGLANTASAVYSFAAGRRAKATNQGSFVWADSADADYSSNGNNTFNVRATGGSFFTGSVTITGSVTATEDVVAQTNLKSMYQVGDEGGEIFLNVPATNTTINTGVTIDIYQDTLRIFESGGSNLGYFLNIASGSASAGTDLKPVGFTGAVPIAGNPPGFQTLTFDNGILISVS